MPLTLYRYILSELAKLLLLSTGVLVTVMAVGFVILKTASEGSPDAVGLAKLMLYVVPVMLPYALPVTAAFSATLVYFRMSQDNEITACAMTGVSYRSLLTPVLLLGLATTLALFFLSNYVIPGFWAKVEYTAQRDIARMVVDQLQRKDVVEFGDSVLYADYADEAELRRPADLSAGEPWPYQRIELRHAAWGQINRRTGRLEADYTGELAVADFYRHTDGQTYITVRFENATVRHPASGTLVNVASQSFPAQRIPSFFQVKPRFLALDRLHRIDEHPEEHEDVAEQVQALRQAIIADALLDHMVAVLRGEVGGGVLRLDGPQNERYRLTAPIAVRDGDQLRLAAEGDDTITVRVSRGLEVTQTLRATRGKLDLELARAADAPRLEIKLEENVTVRDPRLPAPNERSAVYLPLLRPERQMTARWRRMSAADLTAAVQPDAPAGVHAAYLRLTDEIESLRREIAIAVNERGALSVCALMVMLLGAVMSMNLRHQTPLVIFFWCFLPAVLGIFIISGGGKNIAGSNPFGLGTWFTGVMIWSGNLFLLAVVWSVYHRLARH